MTAATSQFQPPATVGPQEIAWPVGSDNMATYTHAERLVLRRRVTVAEKVPHSPTCARKKAPEGSVQSAVHDVAGCRRCQLLNEIDVLHQMKVEFGINIADDDPDVQDDAEAAAQTSIFDASPTPVAPVVQDENVKPF